MSTQSFKIRPAYLRAPPGINTAKVTAAVLDTNELLHLIIDAVPTEHRTPLLRVSKAWRAAILRLGHVLKSAGYEFGLQPGEWRPGLPLYRCVIPFKFHRALFNHTSYPDYLFTEVTNSHTTLTSHPYWDAANLALVQHGFATHPPITQLALMDGSGHVASLRVAGGVRVGHLAEYLPKISQKSSAHLYETWAMYARQPLTNNRVYSSVIPVEVPVKKSRAARRRARRAAQKWWR